MSVIQLIRLWLTIKPAKRIGGLVRRIRNKRRAKRGLPPLDHTTIEVEEMEQVNSIIRTIMKVAGTFLVTHGVIDQSMLEPITGVVLAVAAVVWSFLAHDPKSTVV